MKHQDFKKEQTGDGHWYLDCGFVLKRKNQDCNNFFKILIDSFIGLAIEDDKNILPRVQWLDYDTKNPKTMIYLHKVNQLELLNVKEGMK
ncbi:hypothetical protein FC92_GL001088 [Liquorilactobacillus hordei DSM 19519]|uniref:Uncharacterized protein n=2 Tax=Liquorilactobacillus hordei TaxID=468911 RepID=A0A0R1MJ75_9LACO|nr:hypothetical protein FC92_GL001088 [Liquorilactobacillus hordei DSM 19519]